MVVITYLSQSEKVTKNVKFFKWIFSLFAIMCDALNPYMFLLQQHYIDWPNAT